MRTSIFIVLISLLAACGSKVSPEVQAVEAASALYKQSPSDTTAQALIAAMTAYIDLKGYADTTSARYIVQSARIAADHNQYRQAINFYKTYLIEYPERPDQPDRLVNVITLYEKFGKPELNDILYKSFVTRFPKDTRAPSMNAKVQNKEIAADSILRYIGMNMFNDSTFRLNEERASLYIDACEAAVMANPTLPKAADYLHRAAETARTLRDIPRAIDLYDWIISKYPTDPRASTSMFLKAFTYDNDLKDFDNAGKYYNEYLSKNPKGEFAESAKFLLDNLGKSEEELMKKMLEQQDKKEVQ